jgi:hypothetical protein
MLHIIIGLLFVALGIWSIFDEYYYVSDFIKGGFPLLLIVSGLMATLAGFIPPEISKEMADD